MGSIPVSTSIHVVCQVCGANGAGHHYNGLVCSCCRVFFIRQTRRKRKPVCRDSWKCEMRPGAADNCRSCRYKKCLDANMKPDVVGLQRYTKRNNRQQKKEEKKTEKKLTKTEENSMLAFPASEEQSAEIPSEAEPSLQLPLAQPVPMLPQFHPSSSIAIEPLSAAPLMMLPTIQVPQTDLGISLLALQQ